MARPSGRLWKLNCSWFPTASLPRCPCVVAGTCWGGSEEIRFTSHTLQTVQRRTYFVASSSNLCHGWPHTDHVIYSISPSPSHPAWGNCNNPVLLLGCRSLSKPVMSSLCPQLGKGVGSLGLDSRTHTATPMHRLHVT